MSIFFVLRDIQTDWHSPPPTQICITLEIHCHYSFGIDRVSTVCQYTFGTVRRKLFWKYCFLCSSESCQVKENKAEEMSKPTLYYMKESPPCRTVMAVARIIGLDLELKTLSLFEKEQLNEDFIRVSLASFRNKKINFYLNYSTFD